MGPIWGRQDPGGPHVGSMNFAIGACTLLLASAACVWKGTFTHCQVVHTLKHITTVADGWHIPALGTYDTNHLELIWVYTSLYVLASVDTCVPSNLCRLYADNLWTYCTNHLDFIKKWATRYVGVFFGTGTRTDMYRHVPTLAAHLTTLIWILFVCRHLCRHLRTCPKSSTESAKVTPLRQWQYVSYPYQSKLLWLQVAATIMEH